MEKILLYRRIKTGTALLMAALLMCACGGGKDPAELRDLGAESYQAGHYEEALMIFEEALEAGRGSAGETQYDILRFKAECELRTGRYDAARATYEILLQIDESEENRALYGKVLGGLDDLQALKAGNEAFAAGRYDEARELYAGVSDLDGGNAGQTAWYNEAVAAEFQHDYAGALRLMREYLEKFPDDAAAQKEYAFLKYEGNAEEPYE